jgi:hypothetical protein
VGSSLPPHSVSTSFVINLQQMLTDRDRCLAHIVNLATQAFISRYSKSEYFDPENPDAHEPDTDATHRDVIALIRAITVKVMVISICSLC